MCLEEKIFLYKHILKSNDLPADIKIELALYLDEVPSGAIFEKIGKIISDFVFS